MNLSLRSIAGWEVRASASAGGSLATERRLSGMSDWGRRCTRSPRAGLRSDEPQLPRQPDRQDQLPPVAGASHFAARLDVPPRDGNTYTVHVADEGVMVAERLDVLDLDQVVIFHGGLPAPFHRIPQITSAAPRYTYLHAETPVTGAVARRRRSAASSQHELVPPLVDRDLAPPSRCTIAPEPRIRS